MSALLAVSLSRAVEVEQLTPADQKGARRKVLAPHTWPELLSGQTRNGLLQGLAAAETGALCRQLIEESQFF